jgi:hypothetical protein
VTKQLTYDAGADAGGARHCGRCSQHMPDGPDWCLGYLPAVSHACCGHGDDDKAYVVIGGDPDESWRDMPVSVTLRGFVAIAYFLAHGAGPPLPEEVEQ